MAIAENLQRGELLKLAAENLGMAAKMVHQHARSLLVFRKVATLIKAARARRVHEEVRWLHQLYDEAARTRLTRLRSGGTIAGVEGDILDRREGILDLVAGRIVVDVICHACLVRRIEDNKIHSIQAHTPPRTNCQGTACEMVNDYQRAHRSDNEAIRG